MFTNYVNTTVFYVFHICVYHTNEELIFVCLCLYCFSEIFWCSFMIITIK